MKAIRKHRPMGAQRNSHWPWIPKFKNQLGHTNTHTHKMCVQGHIPTCSPWSLAKGAFNIFLPTVQFSCSVMSDYLWLHGLQHTRLSCSSPTSRACSNSCLLSWWCHPTISSSGVPVSSCPQSFPASGLFPWVSSSHQVAKVLDLQLQHQSIPMSIQDWFPLGLTDPWS